MLPVADINPAKFHPIRGIRFNVAARIARSCSVQSWSHPSPRRTVPVRLQSSPYYCKASSRRSRGGCSDHTPPFDLRRFRLPDEVGSQVARSHLPLLDPNGCPPRDRLSREDTDREREHFVQGRVHLASAAREPHCLPLVVPWIVTRSDHRATDPMTATSGLRARMQN